MNAVKLMCNICEVASYLFTTPPPILLHAEDAVGHNVAFCNLPLIHLLSLHE